MNIRLPSRPPEGSRARSRGQRQRPRRAALQKRVRCSSEAAQRLPEGCDARVEGRPGSRLRIYVEAGEGVLLLRTAVGWLVTRRRGLAGSLVRSFVEHRVVCHADDEVETVFNKIGPPFHLILDLLYPILLQVSYQEVLDIDVVARRSSLRLGRDAEEAFGGSDDLCHGLTSRLFASLRSTLTLAM